MFELVFLDCDSTLSTIEGIDELAREAGALEELAAMTRAAMAGELALEEVYGRRLERIRPSRAQLERLGAAYVEHAVPGAAETVAALRAAGKEVHVVSGGLRAAVLVLARELGLPDERVHAVEIEWDEGGEFLRHDESSPLARSGGKPELCGELLAGRRGAIVGDGMTDAEAVPPCELFVGFGGVEARPAVRERAQRWVEGPSLLGVLEHLLTEDERRLAAKGSSP